MTAKKILVLDFDGVVHSYVSPWVDSHVIADAPVPGALDFIRRALDVFDVQIYSSRSASSTGRTAMQGWLLDHAMQLDKDDYSWVFNVKWPDTKPPAHITLDDRVWCFTGSWPPLDEPKTPIFEPSPFHLPAFAFSQRTDKFASCTQAG